MAFVAGRARPNTVRAIAFDLKAFFTVVGRDPVEVTSADVLDFVAVQRGDRSVVRLADRESGLSARTIARRLASVSGFYAYVVARGDTPVAANPVPRGLATRRQGASKRARLVPLVRVPKTLPRVLTPGEVSALVSALRTARDRAMVEAMVLGGLRRCEVLGLTLDDLLVAERRVFIAEGKGGHQRVVPVSGRFFASVGDYLDLERPEASTDRLFVVLKGPRRGQPLSSASKSSMPATSIARRSAGDRSLIRKPTPATPAAARERSRAVRPDESMNVRPMASTTIASGWVAKASTTDATNPSAPVVSHAPSTTTVTSLSR